MTYRMFLDDEREPPEDGQDWLVFRSSSHSIGFMMIHGLPDFISFDHDLGGLDTAMVVVGWLQERLAKERKKRPFDFYVHSQNPIGKANIEGAWKGYDRFAEENGFE